MNISNTPLRVGKTSLSPLRMRKVNQQGNLTSQSNLNNQSNQVNASVRANFSKRRNN